MESCCPSCHRRSEKHYKIKNQESFESSHRQRWATNPRQRNHFANVSDATGLRLVLTKSRFEITAVFDPVVRRIVALVRRQLTEARQRTGNYPKVRPHEIEDPS